MALDFPSTPTNGQVYDNFYYDSAKGTWKSLSSGASPSILVNPTITDGVITATAPNSTTVPLTVTGAVSQSASLQEWKNVSGTTLSWIGPTGDFKSGFNITSGLRDVNYNGAYLNMQSTNGILIHSRTATNPGLIIKGSTSQSANLQEWQNSAGAALVKIDSVGRVSMPAQPAFSVQGTGTQSWSGTYVATKVVMNGTILINRGSYYATSNSRFTAPVNGAYCFHMSSAVTTNITGPEIVIYKNGALTVGNFAIGYDALYNTFGATAILNLVAGDYVEMYIYNNNSTSFTIDRSRTLFSGYLIG